MSIEQVILVDEHDNELGVMEKMEAHQKGLLHRAFSVFIFNKNNQLLLQQRSLNKYHSAGLWTNTCCSHPRENETILQAANRRLKEEMGIECQLSIKHKFIYCTPFENGLTEHELDYIVTGISSVEPKLNTNEVSNYKWVGLDYLLEDVNNNPNNYTSWFKIILEESYNYLTV
ncbi:MAG: isopentenyl-diphosphate Delta-isomerase [Bacteroidia bacterium]